LNRKITIKKIVTVVIVPLNLSMFSTTFSRNFLTKLNLAIENYKIHEFLLRFG